MHAQHRSRRRLLCASVLAGATALAGFATTGVATADETGQIRNAGAANAVPDSYIVALKESEVSAKAVGQAAANLASRYDGEVKFTYDDVLNGFSVTMTEQQALRLAAHPDVAYVEQDGIAQTQAVQNNPVWGLDRADQTNLPMDDRYSYPDSAGEGVTTYVIDTGIRTGHTEFGGRARSGYDFIDNDSNSNDCNGHGTHVAGTVGGTTYGMAKKAGLVGVRVLDCGGRGAYSVIIAGMDWVAENAQKPAVANMSIGGPTDSSVNRAATGLMQSGVTTVVAAGNSNEDACNSSPASASAVITVGASNTRDERSTWPEIPGAESNYGRCLDIWAPGTDITSAWIGSNSDTRVADGTSMASPHVAGAAALHLGLRSSDSPQQVRDALVGNATSGLLTGIRSGSPNKLLNTTYLHGEEPGPGPDPEPGEQAPVADFSVQCGFNTGCTFDASASTDDTGIESYAWDFGDGNTGTGETVRHNYSQAGNVTATLTVTDADGLTDAASRTLQCYDFGNSAFCFPG
ncbi:Serine protease, subtilisin family [Amycolatopsis marina]|uniref:Serine protease, subtilisin family n=1 Tax=Amycolatopsis marina TaxID=490629 RepID=A0A1I1AZ22_9PSEU|nr:S8 family serine peptidase [Amycolatopsis marina]SFB43324.1 Serine protease, subtilisin family [Amycolatopsis marina]